MLSGLFYGSYALWIYHWLIARTSRLSLMCDSRSDCSWFVAVIRLAMERWLFSYSIGYVMVDHWSLTCVCCVRLHAIGVDSRSPMCSGVPWSCGLFLL